MLNYSDLAVENLVGMNINKEFMPSVANTIGTDLTKYKVIKKNQFAYNHMQVGRDRTIRVARYPNDDSAIISPAYKIFQVTDEKILLPEFLMLYFRRSEFDRVCWFHTDSSIRGSMDWSKFCDLEIPLPNLEVQKKIVDILRAEDTSSCPFSSYTISITTGLYPSHPLLPLTAPSLLQHGWRSKLHYIPLLHKLCQFLWKQY